MNAEKPATSKNRHLEGILSCSTKNIATDRASNTKIPAFLVISTEYLAHTWYIEVLNSVSCPEQYIFTYTWHILDNLHIAAQHHRWPKCNGFAWYILGRAICAGAYIALLEILLWGNVYLRFQGVSMDGAIPSPSRTNHGFLVATPFEAARRLQLHHSIPPATLTRNIRWSLGWQDIWYNVININEHKQISIYI